ncbi:hypothetical protein KA005_57185, partial [bacterium]|nr:hypothetical protein [bacterium]
IKENELMMDTSDMWDMRYSGNSIKIWRMSDGKKRIFIELIIGSELIVIKRMETIFNGKPFRIYKPRAPHKAKVLKLERIVRFYEGKYKDLSEQIDALPRENENHNDWGDMDAFVKQSQKDIIRTRFEQAILYDHQKEFKWNWPYYSGVVYKLFNDSEIFGSSPKNRTHLSKEDEKILLHISKIKEKYGKDFDELDDIVVEYGGVSFSGNIMI